MSAGTAPADDAAQHEAVARQATEQSWGYAAYLLELVQRECQQRRHNRIERLLKASRLPLEKSWSALDLKLVRATFGKLEAASGGCGCG